MKESSQQFHKGIRPTLVALAVFVLGMPVLRADEATEMAQQIARLRGEVEDLASEVESKKEYVRGGMRSLATQKADLEMEVQRAELALKQLREVRQERKEEILVDQKRDDILKPAVLEAIGIVKKEIRAGLPFKQEDRLAELDRLINQIEDGLLKPTTAVARLWDRVEDEYRLSRENGIYRQVIHIGSEEILAEVAKVGMVMLYFRTQDGRFGMSVRENGDWQFKTVTRKENKEQIQILFDSFKKQIRTGFFVLPNALPKGREQL